MEIEKEKRKIEFWSGEKYMILPFNEHKPDDPFAGPVEVSATITFLADCEPARPSTAWLPARDLASGIVDWLVYFKYVKHERQIVRLSIEKMEGRNPGVAFIMQEVE